MHFCQHNTINSVGIKIDYSGSDDIHEDGSRLARDLGSMVFEQTCKSDLKDTCTLR